MCAEILSILSIQLSIGSAESANQSSYYYCNRLPSQFIKVWILPAMLLPASKATPYSLLNSNTSDHQHNRQSHYGEI